MVGQELINEGLIDIKELKGWEPIVGMLLGTKLNNGRMVLSAFVKKNKDDKAKLEDVAGCLASLRDYMVSEKSKTISLTKTGDGLDHIPWITLEQALKRQAEGGNFIFTACTGIVREPALEERLGIIIEAHDSGVGGIRAWPKFTSASGNGSCGPKWPQI